MKRLALVVVAVVACTTVPAPHQALERHDWLAEFAATLADAGMSVALPPRYCDHDGGQRTQWVDDPGCLTIDGIAYNDAMSGFGDRRAEFLTPYARALVHAHLPDAPDERADALVAAYVAGDPALASLALAIERDFDLRRAKASKSEKPAKKEPKGAKDKKVDVADAGPVIEGDAGVVEERGHPASDALDDAGPAGLTLHDKIVGTWTGVDGAVRDIYAFCDDGNYTVQFEVVDESLSFEMPAVHGKWDAVVGDPPKLAFTSPQGEREEATLTSVTEDSLGIAWDSESQSTLSRRSRSAACE